MTGSGPPYPFRYNNLESGTSTRFTCLGDGDPGNGKDLAREKKAKARVMPKTAGEEHFFVLFGDTDAIIFDQNDPFIPRCESSMPRRTEEHYR